MASVYDVAAYVLGKLGPITAMKLQKLVYYSQAWSLVWDEKPIFPESIEAWAMGPVVPELYQRHRGKFYVASINGAPDALIGPERETIEAVVGFYGNKSSQWLSNLTHQEDPWRNARHGVPPSKLCDREITHSAMAEYYGGLTPPTE